MEYRISKNDFNNAFKLHNKYKFLKIYLVFVVIFFIIGLISQKGDSKFEFHAVMTLSLVYGFFMIILSRFIAWKNLKQYDENLEYQSSFSIEIVNNELKLRSDKTITSIPRNRIIKIKKNDQVVLLYRSAGLFHLIPTNIYLMCPDLIKWVEIAQQGDAPETGSSE